VLFEEVLDVPAPDGLFREVDLRGR